MRSGIRVVLVVSASAFITISNVEPDLSMAGRFTNACIAVVSEFLLTG